MVHEYKGNKLQLGLSILPTPTQICYSQLQHIYIIPLPTPTHITTLYSLLQPYIYKTTYSLLPHRYTTYYPYSHSYILLSTSYSHFILYSLLIKYSSFEFQDFYFLKRILLLCLTFCKTIYFEFPFILVQWNLRIFTFLFLSYILTNIKYAP